MKKKQLIDLLKYSAPLILGLLLASYVYDGKENYVMTTSKIVSSIIGGLIGGFFMCCALVEKTK